MTDTQDTSAAIEVKLEELRAKYGALAKLQTPDGWIICKKPSRGDYNRFQDAVVTEDSSKSKSTAMLQLVMACVVHPAAPIADAMFDKWPAAATQLAGALRQMAGSKMVVELEGN